jgi:hypothetical protein
VVLKLKQQMQLLMPGICPHLNAWVCVAQLWVVLNDVSTSVIATSKFETQRLWQIDLQHEVCGQRAAVLSSGVTA